MHVLEGEILSRGQEVEFFIFVVSIENVFICCTGFPEGEARIVVVLCKNSKPDFLRINSAVNG